MTCKDCLHYEACKGTYMNVSEYKSITDFDDEHYTDIYHCPDFADKAEWFHFPSKDCKIAYYAVGYGDEARVIAEPICGWGVKNGRPCVIDACGDLYEIETEVFLTKEEAEKEVERRKNR
jgi:hypothetical protein